MERERRQRDRDRKGDWREISAAWCVWCLDT